MKKNNEAIEDKLEGKIKELQMELEDKKLDHRAVEGSIDRDITKRVRVINDLRKSLTRRYVVHYECNINQKSNV